MPIERGGPTPAQMGADRPEGSEVKTKEQLNKELKTDIQEELLNARDNVQKAQELIDRVRPNKEKLGSEFERSSPAEARSWMVSEAHIQTIGPNFIRLLDNNQRHVVNRPHIILQGARRQFLFYWR